MSGARHGRPHDWAPPIPVYIAVGCYAGLRRPADDRRFAELRAALTGIVLAVCFITI
jgi:hypothetical protein